MERIIGIIPAGGQAKRIHGFFKEMMPIGTNNMDRSKFIVSSERIIQNIINGGATSIHFVLSKDKTFIIEYYTQQGLFSGFINWNPLDPKKDNRGMPFTIDHAYNSLIYADYVLMGMPDTVIEPPESFSTLLNLQKSAKADLALGLYHIDKRNKGGYIEFDSETKVVKRHIDKISETFPDDADNAWAIACWNTNFTEYIHAQVKRFEKIVSNQKDDEFIFGHLIDAAISDPAIKVVADFVDEKNFYWDIAEPEKYFDLLRYYSPGRPFTKYPTRKCLLDTGGHPNGKIFETIYKMISNWNGRNSIVFL